MENIQEGKDHYKLLESLIYDLTHSLMTKDDITKINLQIPRLCSLIPKEDISQGDRLAIDLNILSSLLIFRNSSIFKGDGPALGYELSSKDLEGLGNLKFLEFRLRRCIFELLLIKQEKSICLLDENGTFSKSIH